MVLGTFEGKRRKRSYRGVEKCMFVKQMSTRAVPSVASPRSRAVCIESCGIGGGTGFRPGAGGPEKTVMRSLHEVDGKG